MTEIEKMWDDAKARVEPVPALASYTCVQCGADADVDKVSGCVTCKTCGNKECGDG